MKFRVTVAGVGPGGESYILPVVREAVAAADVLVGGHRALSPFFAMGKEVLPVTADLAGLAEQLKVLSLEKKVVVLVSGDPGFYSLLTYLRRHFSAEELEVIPGVSSVQVAFARLAEPWQDAVFFSTHGREGTDILNDLLLPGKKAVLTDKVWNPGRIAQAMLDCGARDSVVALCRSLTNADEKICLTKLSELAGTDVGDCVMVIIDE
ncbi:MAG: Cobalamin biosynthesis bifunctional protein CbiET [Dehalococcoidia bacterium]|nr:Cobalamin biosynthesis bifunctional protein CbiET [Bacillota bacterium]